MQIIKATPADYDELLAVWQDSVQASHDFWPKNYILVLRPIVRERLLPNIERFFYTKDASGKIIGFIGISDRFIDMLFLRADERGKGIGKNLLAYAIEELHCNSISVNEQNPKARKFYEHFGFRVVRRSPLDGMGQPFPILFMELSSDT